MRRSISKIVAATLMIVFVFALFPEMKLKAATSGTCGNNATWTLDDEGTLTISGRGSISDNAFENNNNIAKVIIESEIDYIGSAAFKNCTKLTEVIIPDSVHFFSNEVFMNCTSLASITIPNSVRDIGPATFQGCTSLKSVTLSNSLAAIGNLAFFDCTSLTSITIPNSVNFIGNFAFEGCTSLTSITIPNSVTSIYLYAFNGCTSLTSVTIPNSVTMIDNAAFLGCTGLTSVTIPNSVTSIGDFAFEGCTSLTSITIRKSLYEQCQDAFPNISSDAFYFYTEYEITFKNYDDTVLESKKVVAGETPSYTGKVTPTKPSDGAYSYEFAGWDPKPGAVTGPATYIAVYDKKEIKKYEVTFKNYDDTVLESKKVAVGETPSYTGKVTPTKPSDGAYSYEFAGWDPIPGAITGPATYTAVYNKKEIKYKVKFVDLDGITIQSDDLTYLKVPVFTGKTPTKEENETSTFVFAGWTDGNTTYGVNEELPQITGDTTFKPVFKAVPKPVYTVGEVKGDGIKSDIVIDVHRDSDDENCLTYFSKATIDGTEMTIGDQYTATKGSTIITIKKDFLSTLSAGEHEVQVVFNDGSISTKVTIAAKASVPSTGEVTGPATYIGLALIVTACACGAGIILLKKRKVA